MSSLEQKRTEMNTKDAAQRWNCRPEEVRAWCRGGDIGGVRKEKNRWVIPDDARRPIDKKLQSEMLWQILEMQQEQRARIDLTIWGVPRNETIGYLQALFDCCLQARFADPNEPIRTIADIQLTERGLHLLGRRGRVQDNRDAGAMRQMLDLGRAAIPIADTFLRLFEIVEGVAAI